MDLRLLPGEKVELGLRPSPWSWLRRYALALSWLAWGALVTAVTLPWRTSVDQPGLPVGALAASLLAVGGPLLVAAAIERARHAWTLAGTILAMSLAAVATALGAWATRTLELPLALGLGFAVIAVLAIAWAEVRRATTWLLVTNLRLVVRTRWPRREVQVRHSELADLDLRQGPLARRLDMAHLVAVAPEGGLEAPGIRPAARVKRLVQVLVRRATATEYLREQQGLDREVADAMAALQRR